jgi:RHS repeat-associated protein
VDRHIDVPCEHQKINVPEYMIKGGVNYKLITDQVGSVRFVVNADTGAIAQSIEYSSFGEVLSDSNPGFQPFGFAGGIYDHQTKLVRFGARDYDPSIGRWVSKDPIQFEGGTTNLYEYVFNDPVNLIDPEGEIATAPAIGIGIGIGISAPVAIGIGIGVGIGAIFLPDLVDQITNVFSQRGKNRVTIEPDQRSRLEDRLSDPNTTKKGKKKD